MWRPMSVLRPPHVLKFVTYALILRRHTAICLLLRGTMFSRLGMYPKRALDISHLDGYYPVSETIVHFHSYERYKVWHTGRK
jgi:hypothetical protein